MSISPAEIPTENGVSSRRKTLSEAKRILLDRRLQGGTKPTAPGSDVSRRTGRTNRAPLSFAQERLWFLTQLDPDSALYNMPLTLRLKGRLNLAALRRALDAIAARHEILRTRFISEDGNPVQLIDPPTPMALTIIDLGHETGLRKILIRESSRPFDLSRDPVLRGALFRLGEDDHVLHLVMHHIVSDAWSWSVFFHELTLFYDAFAAEQPIRLPELPIQYADFAVWQRDRLQDAAVAGQRSFWKHKLAGAPHLLDLPTDRPRPAVQTFRGQFEVQTIPDKLGDALKILSRREGVTLFMLLLAVFKVLLHRYSHQSDIVVGTPVAGRTRVQTEGLIGLFVNTLAIRTNLSGDPTFLNFLRQVREETIEAFSHQDLPFEYVIEELRPERSSSHPPLVQVMFVLQSTPVRDVRLAGLEITPVETSTGTAKFDLTLGAEETPSGLSLSLEYSTGIFEQATAVRMLNHFKTLLEAVTTDPSQPVSRLPILTESERHQLLVDWNGTETSYPRDASIPLLFTGQAVKTPDAVAVVSGSDQLTYLELNHRANQLAHHLQKLGVGPDVLVGVCLERSVDMIVGLLGILKAGGAYVSLDPAYPHARLKVMLEETKPPVLLTHESLHSKFEPVGDELNVVRLDTGWPVVAGEPAADPASTATAENLAYVSFTSGSTGRPKGVSVTQRGVIRLVRGTDFATFGSNGVFLQLAPIAFDASTLEIWGPLLNGGRLVLFPPHTPSLAELGAFIKHHQITTLWLTAGLFHQMIEEDLESLRGIRQLLAGGDVLSVPHVKIALEALPGCHLINGYGPTENTTFTCCHHITSLNADGRSIPIGRPIANTRIYVLDEHQHPVPIGVPGELYVGGDGLARGYLNQPELTAERFIPHPFSSSPDARLYKTGDRVRWLPDGTIEFFGRMDQQVKIRGFRVEPGEIEGVLAEHPAVRECVVVAHGEQADDRQLAAYFVTEQTDPPLTSELRDHLCRKLPDYMVPAVFLRLDALPLNANGKVDRQSLPAPDRRMTETARQFVGPRDEIEVRLAEIWESVLRVSSVSVNDRFFDLGGHSLLAVRLVARMEKTFGRTIPVAAVFQSPTIAQLARIIREGREAGPGSSLVEIQPGGSQPPLFFVHGVGGGMFWGYINLSKYLGSDQPVYAFRSRGMNGQEELGSIEEMAAQYVADLRAFQPAGPYRLGGYCFGGNVAYEMARQLSAQGAIVEFLLLMNCTPPNSSYMRITPSPVWVFRFLRNLLYLAGCFFSWTSQQRRAFLRWKAGVVWKKICQLFHLVPPASNGTHVQDVVDLSGHPPEQRKLWEIHVQALMRHETKPYAGHVTLFRSRGHQFMSSFDPLYGWGDLATRGVTVRIIPGAHESILEEPHVSRVASELNRCVETIVANPSKE